MIHWAETNRKDKSPILSDKSCETVTPSVEDFIRPTLLYIIQEVLLHLQTRSDEAPYNTFPWRHVIISNDCFSVIRWQLLVLIRHARYWANKCAKSRLIVISTESVLQVEITNVFIVESKLKLFCILYLYLIKSPLTLNLEAFTEVFGIYDLNPANLT